MKYTYRSHMLHAHLSSTLLDEKAGKGAANHEANCRICYDLYGKLTTNTAVVIHLFKRHAKFKISLGQQRGSRLSRLEKMFFINGTSCPRNGYENKTCLKCFDELKQH